MSKVFISRQLPPDSPLLHWAQRTGHEVEGRSLIKFSKVAFVPPAAEEADWWYFYSPRAVEFAAGSIPMLKPGLPAVKIAAMGPGTARAMREAACRLEPDFVGAGSPEEVAAAFADIGTGQTVFFPRARQSRQTVQRLLQHHITVLDAVCYDNVAVPASDSITADVFVFTSPLNVAAYLDHQELSTGAQTVAIGPSTGAALAERGITYLMTEAPGETSLVKLLEELK